MRAAAAAQPEAVRTAADGRFLPFVPDQDPAQGCWRCLRSGPPPSAAQKTTNIFVGQRKVSCLRNIWNLSCSPPPLISARPTAPRIDLHQWRGSGSAGEHPKVQISSLMTAKMLGNELFPQQQKKEKRKKRQREKEYSIVHSQREETMRRKTAGPGL